MDADKSNAQQPIQHRLMGSWALPAIDYFDSKARLLAIGSKEGAQHFVELLMLMGVQLVLASLSILMYSAFLLYLVALVLHLAWDYSALINAVLFSLACVLAFSLLRLGPRESVFRMTLKDFKKDKPWLGQSKIKAY